jgi:hypothetical protein
MAMRELAPLWQELVEMTTPRARIGPVGVDVSESTGSIEDYLDTAPELEQIVVDLR